MITLKLKNKMKPLTLCQIATLIDIARGTDTQSKVASHKYDLSVLKKRQLIHENGTVQLTKPGKQLVENLQLQTTK